MSNPLLLNITQAAISPDCTCSSGAEEDKQSGVVRESGFGDLLIALMNGGKSSSGSAVMNSAESAPTDEPLPGGIQARKIPVDVVFNPGTSGDGGQIDPALLELVSSLGATLEITNSIDGESVACDVLQSTGGQPNARLRLDIGYISSAIPVEISDSLLLPAEENSDQRFVLKVADDARLLLIKQSNESSSCDSEFEIASRPETTVRQVLLVTDPVKLMKHLMPDISGFGGRRQSSAPQRSVAIQPNGQLSAPIRVATGDSRDAAGNDERRQEGSHSEFDRKGLGDGTSNTFLKRPFRLETEHLARDWVGQIDRWGKATTDAQPNESGGMELETSLRPLVFQKSAGDVAPEMSGAFRSGHSEPVRFQVHLSDIGLKFAEVSSFRVSLQPEYLGNVRVHLVMVEDRLTARLTVESPVAGQAVEANLPGLKETLMQHGIRVEHFTVDVAGGGDQDRERNARKNQFPGSPRGSKLGLETEESTPVWIQPPGFGSRRSLPGAINLVA